MRWLSTALFLVLGTVAVAAGGTSLETARGMAESFLRGQVAEVWHGLSPEVQQLFGSPEDLQGFREELTTSFGEETEVLEEEVEAREGVETYVRTARWSRSAAPIVTELGIAPDGTVISFLVRPQPVLAESRFLGYQTKARLRLPFEGNGSWSGVGEHWNKTTTPRTVRNALPPTCSSTATAPRIGANRRC